ncbi:MAG: hypothetical protein WCC14_09255 [Acidobacteriaceae bacterium]
MWLQQEPGQHEPWCWQQLAPQQLPGQQVALFVQQAAPVTASADSENSDIATSANTFDFMMDFLSV